MNHLTVSVLGLIISIFSFSSNAGTFAYVPNSGSNNVSVIDTSNNTVTTTISVGANPLGVSVSPDGTKVYVTNNGDNTVSVIRTSDNTVTANITVGSRPQGVSISPDGTTVYVANYFSNTVSVIRTSDNTVTTIGVGNIPKGVSVSPDGTKVYVANYNSNNISVIQTSDNTVIATVGVGTGPISFGNFIATVPEPSSPASIPTLSEWTQIALAFMTFGLLFWYQKRESV